MNFIEMACRIVFAEILYRNVDNLIESFHADVDCEWIIDADQQTDDGEAIFIGREPGVGLLSARGRGRGTKGEHRADGKRQRRIFRQFSGVRRHELPSPFVERSRLGNALVGVYGRILKNGTNWFTCDVNLNPGIEHLPWSFVLHSR
ncbi:MAG: hypothetical protein WBW32_08550 [Luteibacter sp.]